MRLELAPGAYRVEGRASGDVVARETVTVRGEPVHVSLSMPEGNVGSAAAGELEGGDELVVVAPELDPELVPEPVEEAPAAMRSERPEREARREPSEMRALPMRAVMAATMAPEAPDNPF